MSVADHNRILVIKLGALGDFILATGPFKAIRVHHPDAQITLLTGRAYADMGRATGWFDQVWVDERPRWTQPLGWLRLRRRLAGGRFDRVYDLQTADRSALYYRLFPSRQKPEWSGVAAGCSHPHANPARDHMHTLDRQAEQLAMAGIDSTPGTDLDWLDADVGHVAPPGPFALLVPGGAAHRPAKRWPVARYQDLARRLIAAGVTPVLLGTAEEADLAGEIAAAAAGSLDLAGQTGFGDIAALARRAAVGVGNDTGPMHIIAACDCRSVVLFSHDSDPALCAPRGRDVRIHRTADLRDIGVDRVLGDAMAGVDSPPPIP